jgi:hypothetical protein
MPIAWATPFFFLLLLYIYIYNTNNNNNRIVRVSKKSRKVSKENDFKITHLIMHRYSIEFEIVLRKIVIIVVSK